MTTRGVSVLKFVGTVSLGLLTGVSFTLSTLTIPALLTLPSANDAARALESLSTSARKHLRTLSTISGSAFAIAYYLSPRAYRHPYLIYTSLLVFGSRFITSGFFGPYFSFITPAVPASFSSGMSSVSFVTARSSQQKKKSSTPRGLEASYEVLGDPSHSEATSGSEDVEEELANVNGEEVRANVEVFLKKNIVQSVVAGVAFLMSVVGIWGDGLGQQIIVIA
ncbi:hypothetical protein GE21DRAFT_6303 [Neurospora crassa]|uniref:Autophagy-related protein 33 n=1 Tax=Neurospora crassa (strain ATCC 24698 / 74-OR23-1A / CBS 708.71 / DSM 1257 / FGSC 987) TaxID=367110 RepID=Q7S8V9_NEUCR|nr:hypothetical protein NCU08676 [Neurospora crassa OR74A]EAA32789.1 hypothetical protein NCU08676 [Neurospora crassa OR74A]KHE82844.1 hypothetical protein GE21DRAFT_6303 [Neurospora crassa]|eukprot:XP_962025.1 hypothetical protein NCU08676 [Neurospora crassa OR74A]